MSFLKVSSHMLEGEITDACYKILSCTRYLDQDGVTDNTIMLRVGVYKDKTCAEENKAAVIFTKVIDLSDQDKDSLDNILITALQSVKRGDII